MPNWNGPLLEKLLSSYLIKKRTATILRQYWIYQVLTTSKLELKITIWAMMSASLILHSLTSHISKMIPYILECRWKLLIANHGWTAHSNNTMTERTIRIVILEGLWITSILASRSIIIATNLLISRNHEYIGLGYVDIWHTSPHSFSLEWNGSQDLDKTLLVIHIP